MQRHDSPQRFRAAAIVYAIAGVLFVALAAVTQAWWIVAVGVMYLLLAAWNTRQLRHLPPFPTERDGAPPSPTVV